MTAAPREFDRDMQRLEAEIKRLEVEYNMFFAGRLPRLPWEQRSRVEAMVRRYDRGEIANTADRFRFNSLQARFSAFVELWERQLKAQEQGRPRGARAVVASGSAAPAAARQEPPAPRDLPVSCGEHAVSVRDPEREVDRIEELYEYLAAAKREAGQPPLAFDRVAALVRDQVGKHRHGAHALVFKVAVREGRVVLTVTPEADE